MDLGHCPIWGGPVPQAIPGLNWYLVDSRRAGGKYRFDELSAELIQQLDARQKALLTSWLMERRRSGDAAPLVDRAAIVAAKSRRPMRMTDKFDALFRYLSKCGVSADDQWAFREDLPQQGGFDPLELLAEMEARSYDEGAVIYGLLVNEGYISPQTAPGMWLRLTPSGYRRMEELETTNRDSRQAFVAMWFGAEMDEPWRLGFAPAVRDAGYLPLRIDRKEFNSKIDDEIVAEIKRSRFLIADFTCGEVLAKGKRHTIPRGGVYYEAGLAHGLGLEVIFTCRADQMNDVHFDTRQFAHIVWKTPEDLRSSLFNRIAATLGEAPGAPGRGTGNVDPLATT